MCKAVYGLCSPILLFILNLQMPAFVSNVDHFSSSLQKWSILAICFADLAILHTIIFVEMRSIKVIFTYTRNFFALVYSIAAITTETVLQGTYTIRSIYLLISVVVIAVVHLMMFLLMALVNNYASRRVLRRIVSGYLGLAFLAVPTGFFIMSLESNVEGQHFWAYFAYSAVIVYVILMGVFIKHAPQASNYGNSSFKCSCAVILTNLLIFPAIAAYSAYEGLFKFRNTQISANTSFNFIFLGFVIAPAAFLTSIVTGFTCCFSVVISSQMDPDADEDPDFYDFEESLLTSEPPEFKKSLLEIEFENCKGTDCAICWEEFQTTDKLIAVRGCNHTFHTDCIMMWTAKKQNCPLCKASIKKAPQKVSEA